MSIRIRADIAHVRSRIPETLASVTPVDPGAEMGDGWLRVTALGQRLITATDAANDNGAGPAMSTSS